MHNPLVSVIIPVYNVETFLRNCLDSVLNQTYQNWEAIVVDDGSTDSSGLICDEYAAKDPRFKVIHSENKGVSHARNYGVEQSKGEYIFFLDSDDFLHKEALSTLTGIAEKHDAGIVQCNHIRGDKTTFPVLKGDIEIKQFDNHSVFTSFAANIIPWGKIYSREVVGNIKFPIRLRNEDDFTTWKYYYNSNSPIIITSQPLYYYTVNNQSYMASQKRKPNLKYFDAYRERIKFFEDRDEPELVALSRIQWLKSIVSISSNRNLSDGQKDEINKEFKKNYSALKKSCFKYPFLLRILFSSYNIMPSLTRRLLKSFLSLR